MIHNTTHLTAGLADCVPAPGVLWQYCQHVQRSGKGPGSVEPESTAGLDYWVMSTSSVETYIPTLFFAYHRLADAVSDLLKQRVKCVGGPHAINVNMLVGVGARYECHTDRSPYTLILFAGGDYTGGELKLEPNISLRRTVYSTYGTSLLFDGSTIPHSVAPLRVGVSRSLTARVSVPMLFVPFDEAETQQPLDSYLYK